MTTRDARSQVKEMLRDAAWQRERAERALTTARQTMDDTTKLVSDVQTMIEKSKKSRSNA